MIYKISNFTITLQTTLKFIITLRTKAVKYIFQIQNLNLSVYCFPNTI